MIKIKVIYRPADTLSCRLVYALFIYVVIAGVGGLYRRRLHYFLRTRPRRRKNHTYCVKCSPSRATPNPPWIKSQTSLPRRSLDFSPPRIARPWGATLALRTLSAGDRSGSHGPGGSWTLMDDGWWREGIMYDSYVRAHRRVFYLRSAADLFYLFFLRSARQVYFNYLQ